MDPVTPRHSTPLAHQLKIAPVATLASDPPGSKVCEAVARHACGAHRPVPQRWSNRGKTPGKLMLKSGLVARPDIETMAYFRHSVG